MSSSDIEIETIRRSGSLQNARLPSTSNLNDSYSFKSLAENSYASNDSYSYNARDGLRDTSAGSAGGSYSRQQTDTLIIGSSDCSDDEVQVLGPPKMNGKDRRATFPSSEPDDLPAPFGRSLSVGLPGAPAPRRLPQPRPPPAANPVPPPARSTSRAPSQTLAYLDNFRLDPPAPPPEAAASQTKDKGKGKGKARAPSPDWAESESEDEYDKMAKKGPQVAKRKRPKTGGSLLGVSELLGVPADGDGDHPPPKKKTAKMLAAEEKEAKKREQQAAKQAKEEAKKAEAAAKVARAKANNLKSGDKHATVAELTVHLSGTAFRSEDSGGDTDSDEDSDAMYETAAERKRRKKAKQKKASSWVEIGGLLRERMSEHGCQVETPEVPRQDVGCEGAMRWTRWCDKKWNDELREFEPLGAGSEIVVEEDSRLVFMTALELSKHVANRTLERHISSILAAIPSHVHLFLMHYGLKTLCREISNSEQAAYREQARANLNGGSAADAPAPKPKAVGTGPKQPGKEALEYELMKVQTSHGLKMIAVDRVEEAVDWLEQICYDVSQKPYQRHKMMHVLTLGTGEDKVVSGKTLEETYVLMLASLRNNGVTLEAAKGVAREYPTISSLYAGWRACRSEREKKEMLAGIGKGHLITGVRTDRCIGKAASEYIYKVFNHRDPELFL